MKLKSLVQIVLVSVFSSVFAVWIFQKYFQKSETVFIQSDHPYYAKAINNEAYADNLELGFIEASERSTASVVFIKTESQYEQRSSFWFFDFDPFGRIGKVSSTGSGVIVSKDGYIVTNNHVVAKADKIEVVLSENNRSYVAELVGSDPSSDLALLKINAKDLSAITFANSEEVRIGQWVLAVGNPFNLNSTVTAGIVSAKGRNINLLESKFPIESFIQTDAAINPGNSGGALVNLRGELVGVNTAIASKTGSYVGYGFAIPANIVIKTITDLKDYGEVQRGFLGIDVMDIEGEMYDKLKVQNGVLIHRVNGTNNAASDKLEAGDVIVKINQIVVKNRSVYDEQLAYLRPGDKVDLEVIRNGSLKKATIKLVNREGTYDLIKKESFFSEKLGAEFELISKLERQTYKIESGIKIYNIKSGMMRQLNIPENFIFTKINNRSFENVKDFIKYMESVKGQVQIEGTSPSGGRQFLRTYIY